MATYADLVAFARTIAVRLGNGKEKAEEAEGWTTCCPVPSHGKGNGDENPSLRIYVDQGIRFKCWSGCSDEAIRAELAALGFRDIPELTRTRGGGKGIITNKIAHADTIDDEWLVGQWKALPDTVYTYCNAQSKPVFFVVRFNENPPQTPKKIIKPVCSAKLRDGKTDFWIQQAFPAPRPLYNLDDLAERPNTPVLVVEGEKAADAARDLLPEFVVTTWAGGSSAFKLTDWTPLRSRDVILWPDNDASGIGAMKGIAALIGKGSRAAASVELVFTETQNTLVDGWDLADYDPDISPPLNELLDQAEEIDLSKLPETPSAADDDEQATKLQGYLDKYVAVHAGSGHEYIDLSSASPLVTAPIPYRVLSKFTLEAKEVGTFLAFTPGTNSRPKIRRFIDLFLESDKKRWFDGYTYDPRIPDRLVQIGKSLRLNLYCGLAYEPKECDLELYQPFIDHIYASCETPEQADYLLDWLAFKIQYPAQMIETMVVLSGRQGCGKTIVCDIIRAILGRHNAVKIGMGELKAPFNSQYSNKLFIDVEEYNPGNALKELREKVKNLITSQTMVVNTKGLPAYENPCYHSIIATTNSPNPEDISFDNRRMTFLRFDNKALRMSGSIISDNEYFSPLYTLKDNPDALGGLCYWLSQRQIDVGKVTKPLPTSMSEEAKTFVDEPVLAFMKSLAWTGTFPPTIDAMPDTTNAYPISNWPQNACAMPRQTLTAMFQKFCVDERQGVITRVKAGRWLMQALMRPTQTEGNITYRYPRGISEAFDTAKTRRWKMMTPQGFTSELRDAALCIPDLKELRYMVEQMAGSYIDWPEQSSDEEAVGVVVDFPGVERDEL